MNELDFRQLPFKNTKVDLQGDKGKTGQHLQISKFKVLTRGIAFRKMSSIASFNESRISSIDDSLQSELNRKPHLSFVNPMAE